ncbi:MAG TPA: copper resistance protein NlpE [Luteimonas sp.]|nr:copper resistance protein NlpE [Luteimonas sp.]
MNRNRLLVTTLGLTALVAFAGCKRESVPAPEVAPPAATQPATTQAPPDATAGTDATAVVDQSMAANSGLNTKAFAGNFSGTLPCASCPGIDTALELHTDGSFVLAETYQGGKHAPVKVDGTWTAEANGSHIRLDPNSKSEQDRVYAITSHDQITQLGSDGQSAANGLDYSLKRDAAR